jgi:HAMP domain-containing protein
VDQKILRQFMSTILKVLTAFLFFLWNNNARRLINLRTITITLCTVKAFIEAPLILDTRY